MTYEEVEALLREVGWRYNLTIGHLILSDYNKEHKVISDIYIPGVIEVLQDLSDTENTILFYRYAKHKTIEEIANAADLTAEKVSRIALKALKTLRSPKNIDKVRAISVTAHKTALREGNVVIENEIRDYYSYALSKITDPSLLSYITLDNRPITELDLSTRAYNCLSRAGIYTIEQLRKMTNEDLLGIRNLGINSAHEIRDKLNGALYPEREEIAPKPVKRFIKKVLGLLSASRIRKQKALMERYILENYPHISIEMKLRRII